MSYFDSMVEEIVASNGPRIAVQMMPFDNENAVALGGHPPSGFDRVATTVFYKSLNRMNILPFPPRSDRIKDEQVKDAYFLMCRGDFLATYSVGHNREGETLTLEAGFDGQKALLKIYLFGTPTVYSQMYPQVYHDCILGALPLEVQPILIWRTLHVFIRNVGAQLPWRVVEMALVSLLGRYGHKYFDETLDVSLMMTDIAINTRASLDALYCGSLYMSTALQALGQPLDAALATEELAEMFLKKEGGMPYIKLLYECARAFEKAGTYDRSYEAFIKSLSACMKYQGEASFDLNEEFFHGVIESFIDMLCEWCSRETNQERENLLVGFATLLAAAGYVPVPRQSTYVSTSYLEALKDAYKRKEKAKKAIRRSLRGSDVETFGEVILGCKSARRTMNLHVADGAGSKPSRIDTPIDTSYNMKNAQKTLLELSQGKPRLYTLCGNPNCKTTSMRENHMCPCEQIYYCGTDCQRSHWKVHRQTCTEQKGKKQEH